MRTYIFSPEQKASFFLTLCVFFSACQYQQQPNEPITKPSLVIPDRPNILWLVTEDMGPYIPSFGDSTILTPNLTRLAAEGVVYPNCYSTSGVCAPSRAAIATGMYPSGFGANHMRTHSHTEITGLPPYEAVPPSELRMISEILRMNGYYCTNNVKTDYQFKPPVTAWDESSTVAHWRNRKPGQPFFAVFNFMVTHESGLFEPYRVREGELRHYQAGDTSYLKKLKTESPPAVREHISREADFSIPPYLPNTAKIRKDLWKMYNNIAEMDLQLGAILKQLEEDGLLENTIIFFYADHGGPLPRQKRLIYDSGINAPLIIRYPGGQQQNTRDTQLISFVDFAPTVLSLAGIKPLGYMQGRAFLGSFASHHERNYIHAAVDRLDGYSDAIRAVRDERFKYIRNYHPEKGYYQPISYREKIPSMQELLRLNQEGKLDDIQAQWFRESKPKEELFDCESDPDELKNLSDNPHYAGKLEEMRKEMDQWLSAIGDDPTLSEGALIDKLWQGKDKKPQTAEPQISVSRDTITLNCATEGASIGYQWIEDVAPASKTWAIYEEPFAAEGSGRLLVQTHRLGYDPSRKVVYDLH